MTRTDWIFSDEGYSLHQEFPSGDSVSNPSDNTNPAELVVDFPVSFNVTQGHTGDDAFSQLSVDIPADIMDRMAIAWCKKRRLHGTLGGSVGREFGSVDCDYDEQASESLEEDAELQELVKDSEEQPEIQAKLEFDNIFEVVARTKEEAKRLKEESDDLIQNSYLMLLLAYITRKVGKTKHSVGCVQRALRKSCDDFVRAVIKSFRN